MRRLSFILVGLCWISYSMAATSIDNLTQLLNRYASYSADFKQITLGANNQVAQQGSGHVLIKRPGKFRWTTDSPVKEQLIINGNTVWRYDVSLMQATKKITTDNGRSDNPVSLLTARVNDLVHNYTVFLVSLQGKSWYELIPRTADAGFKKVYFYFEQGQLTQLIVVNNLGERSLFQFSNIRLNDSIPDSAFIFTPTKGVDVDIES